MTNFERHKNKIIDFITDMAIKNGSLQIMDCAEIDCEDCLFCGSVDCRGTFLEWLDTEYEEPPVDWSKVAVDTPIWISNDGEFNRRVHFAKYEEGLIYVFANGQTSWTMGKYQYYETTTPRYAKLAEEVLK